MTDRKPQMNADKNSSVTICVNLRYLRFARCRDESGNKFSILNFEFLIEN